MPRYKIRDASGSTTVVSLGEDATFAALVEACGGAACAALRCGRSAVTCGAPETTLARDVVPTGSLVSVETKTRGAAVPPLPVPEAPPPPPFSRMPSEAEAPSALETPRSLSDEARPVAPRVAAAAAPREWTCATCTFINVDRGADAALGCELCSVCGTPRAPAETAAPPPPAASARTAARRPVAADGNCLFVALAYLLDGGRPADGGAAAAAAMRAVCAEVVAGDPRTYPDAMLEKPRESYGAWITDATTWGGALELSLLSRHGGARCATRASFDDVALVCVDVRSGVEQRYAGANAASACYVLFDGVHYDPLVFAPRAGAPESPADRTLVGVDDANAQALAARLARDERAKRAFTDTSTFALRCLVCNAGLRGQDDAQTHAAATGHANFAQTGN